MTYLEALLELQVEGFRLVRDAEGYERPIEHEIADAEGESVSPVGIDRRGHRVFIRKVEATGQYGFGVVEARP